MRGPISKFTFDLLSHTRFVSKNVEDLISEKVLEMLELMSDIGENFEVPTLYAFYLNSGLLDYYWRTFGFNFEMKDSDSIK